MFQPYARMDQYGKNVTALCASNSLIEMLNFKQSYKDENIDKQSITYCWWHFFCSNSVKEKNKATFVRIIYSIYRLTYIKYTWLKFLYKQTSYVKINHFIAYHINKTDDKLRQCCADEAFTNIFVFSCCYSCKFLSLNPWRMVWIVRLSACFFSLTGSQKRTRRTGQVYLMKRTNYMVNYSKWRNHSRILMNLTFTERIHLKCIIVRNNDTAHVRNVGLTFLIQHTIEQR